MSADHDHRAPVSIPFTASGSGPSEPAPGGGPPLRGKVTAVLAVLACAACCALPLLIGAGLLTGIDAALAEQVLLAIAGVLIAVAAGLWWLHRRRASRAAAAAGGCGCGGGG